MHVLHVSDLCHLDASFGTERYQHDLVVESGRHGVRGTLLWLAARAVASPPGAAVRVVPLTTPSLDRLRGEVDGLLAADPPTLLHFHSCGRAESVVAQLARQRRIPAVFTYHSPATLCPTGSLLRWGAVVCDGALRAWRCGACTRVEFLRAVPRALHWQRLRQWSAATASIEIGEPESLRQRGRAARAFLASCDRVLVHGAATRRVPLANGVRPEAVTVCPPGVSAAFADAAPARVAPAESEPFVVGYVGRLDRLKGLGVLVDAFMRTTWPAARLRIAGVTAAQRHGAGYAQRVMARARRDPRIGFGGERPLAAGPELYAGLSLVAIPSVGVETGPLALREALCLGLPVLTTTRVGEPELARACAHLVEPRGVAGWTAALEAIFAAARRGVPPAPPPADARLRRTMRDVAADVVAIYRSVLDRRAATMG